MWILQQGGPWSRRNVEIYHSRYLHLIEKIIENHRNSANSRQLWRQIEFQLCFQPCCNAGNGAQVIQKHEKTKWTKKRGVEIDKTRMAAAVRLRPRRCRRASLLRSSQWPGHLLGQHRALERPHHWAPLEVCRPHGFGDLLVWHIDTSTQRWHNVLTQCDDNDSV